MHPVKYPGKSPHGSAARYRWELQNQGRACPVCKAANTKRAAERRERARRAENARVLTAAGVEALGLADLPDIGPLEREVMRDLAGVTGPGTGTLRQTALTLAREMDSHTSRQGKAQLAKQLGEVMGRLVPPMSDSMSEFDQFMFELQTPLAVDPEASIDPWSRETRV